MLNSDLKKSLKNLGTFMANEPGTKRGVRWIIIDPDYTIMEKYLLRGVALFHPSAIVSIEEPEVGRKTLSFEQQNSICTLYLTRSDSLTLRPDREKKSK